MDPIDEYLNIKLVKSTNQDSGEEIIKKFFNWLV